VDFRWSKLGAMDCPETFSITFPGAIDRKKSLGHVEDRAFDHQETFPITLLRAIDRKSL
jgi:hypothetical protein